MTVGESIDDQIYSVVERHHEARHVRVGNGDGFSLLHLFHPERNDRSTTRHHVAIACTANGGFSIFAQFAPFGNGHFLHHRLGNTHGIDGISRFVGGKNHNIAHAVFDGREEHIIGSFYIRANSLHREELARRYLLQGSSRKDIVDARHSDVDRFLIAHIADVEFHFRILEHVAHIILLLFIAGEDADFLDVGLKEPAKYGIAERTSSTSD